MDDSLKKEIKNLLKNGEIKVALDRLTNVDLTQDESDTLLTISLEYKRHERDKHRNLIDRNQEILEFNRIVNNLNNFINTSNESLSPNSLKPTQNAINKKNQNETDIPPLKRFRIILLVLLCIITYFLYNFFNFQNERDSYLKVKVMVNNFSNSNEINFAQGSLIANLGKNQIKTQIGNLGEINFGKIPIEFMDKEISFELELDGYEILDNKNEFIFNGQPIILEVSKKVTKKDNSDEPDSTPKTLKPKTSIKEEKAAVKVTPFNAGFSASVAIEGLSKDLGALYIIPKSLRTQGINSSTAFLKYGLSQNIKNQLWNNGLAFLEQYSPPPSLKCICLVKQSINYEERERQGYPFTVAKGNIELRIINLKSKKTLPPINFSVGGSGADNAYALTSFKENLETIFSNNYLQEFESCKN